MSEITKEQIEQLKLGEVVTVSTNLESSSGEKVIIECYIIPSQYQRKWILVTAVAGNVAIGFVDGMYYGEYGTSKVESPHTMRIRDENFNHTDIRYEASGDGLYVADQERRKGVGKMLMLTIKSIFIGLGAKVMHVNQPKESAFEFYKKLGMQQGLGAFQEFFEDTD